MFNEFLNNFVNLIKCPKCKSIISPCKLDRLNKAPNIVFVGEEHDNENSIRTRKKIFELAANKNFILSTEVNSSGGALPWLVSNSPKLFSNKDSSKMTTNIYCIESHVPYALAVSYEIQRANVEKENLRTINANTIANINLNPLILYAYESLRKKSLCQKCVEAFDISLKSVKEDSVSTESLNQIVSSASEKTLRDFLTQLHIETIDIAQKNYTTQLDGTILPQLLSDEDLNKAGFYNKNSKLKKQTSRFDNKFTEIRDRDFTSIISEIICNSDGKNNTIIILVGIAHAHGMRDLINNLSNGKIKTNYVRSNNPEESIKLMYDLISK